MCYDIKVLLETQLKRAKRKHDSAWVKELEKNLEAFRDTHNYYHMSGFSHPKLYIYTDKESNNITEAVWGLVPFWVKDNTQRQKLWNNTINARGETIFEKPAFKNAAKSKRCLVYLDGFYEHHHFNGNTYPFYISRKDDKPMAIAGLWEEWIDRSTGEILHTFTIVTTKANELLSKIHNNPKLPEPRMPLILTEDSEENWLLPIATKEEKELIQNLIKPNNSIDLKAYTVQKIRGKNYLGNVPETTAHFEYKELELKF
jgi:putative SOS response-associated peptidase YedK